MVFKRVLKMMLYMNRTVRRPHGYDLKFSIARPLPSFSPFQVIYALFFRFICI